MSDQTAERLQGIFRSVLRVPPAIDVRSISTESHGDWDSIAHLNLILAVEQAFNILIAPEDAAKALSFAAMLELVAGGE